MAAPSPDLGGLMTDEGAPDPNEVVRVEAVVRGRVQGVGFRYFAWREAQDLDLEGWVANAADGSLRCLVQGPRHRVEAMLGRLDVTRRDDLGSLRQPRRRAVRRPSWGLNAPHHRPARTGTLGLFPPGPSGTHLEA